MLLKKRHMPAYQLETKTSSQIAATTNDTTTEKGKEDDTNAATRGKGKAKPSKKLSVDDLRKTKAGQGVLKAFDCSIEIDVQVENEPETQYIDYFDFALNDYECTPTFESANIVSHTFDIFGEHVLPFLSNDYVALTL